MVQTLPMRMKLLMAMLALVASVALIGVTADTANAQVTEITSVYNYTNKEIYIWNHESGKRIEIAPAGVYQNKPKPTRQFQRVGALGLGLNSALTRVIS